MDDNDQTWRAVNAELMAIQALLFGIAMALKKRGIGQDVLGDAFDFADTLAIKGVSNFRPGNEVNDQSGRILQILEGLRKAYLN